MRKISAEELKIILDKHLKWLRNEKGGERADLHYADLSYADLSDANLRNADLRGSNLHSSNLCECDLRDADLRNTNLSYTNLHYADLSYADLSDADLCNANLRDADLCNANLHYANLSYADLSYADLSYADLSDADLHYANLRDADLCNANLSDADLSKSKNIDKIYWNIYTTFYPLQCPEKGSYTAYKKADGLIVELEIPEDAKRSSATSRKCRASKAKVISISHLDGTPSECDCVASDRDSDFIYKIGETVEVANFDENRWNECAPGIHHFITREEAVKYS